MIRLFNVDTAPEIAALAPRFAVVPVGSFEQHGPHLPVTTDTLIASVLGERLCARHGGLLVAPLGVACSHEHAGFAGTLSISPRTMIALVEDLVAAIEAQGIGLTVLLNAHGGNHVLANVAQQLNVARPRVYVAPGRQHWQAAIDAAGILHTISEDMHAGEIETSILLHALPEVVRHDALRADHAATARPHLALYGMRRYTTSGVIGFPTAATAEKGARLVERLVTDLGADVEAILAQAAIDASP